MLSRGPAPPTASARGAVMDDARPAADPSVRPLLYGPQELEAQMPQRYGRMRFVPDLETQFRRDYAAEGYRARLWMLFVSLILFTLAGTFGSAVFGAPEEVLTFTTPANWALVAVIALSLVVVLQPSLRHYSDAALIGCGFCIAILMTCSAVLARQHGLYLPDGLGIIYLSALLVLARIPFRRAVVTTGMVVILMIAIQIDFYGAAETVSLRYLEQVLLLAISAGGGWLLELNSRKLWLEVRILECVSRTDPLTGIVNRRGFEEALHTLERFAVRERRPMTLMVVDLDGFKGVNDRYGHEYGDEVLKKSAQFLSSQTRRDWW